MHITTQQHDRGHASGRRCRDVGDAPLVADTSSDIFSGPIDVGRFGLIYAGAQKNLGPSGVTLVIVREDLLGRARSDTLPTMLNYKMHAENNSLYNTPPTFGIYILGLTMKWLKSLGGLRAIAQINERKAAKLYAEIDRTGFYRGTAQKDSRSLMNVTFRLPSEELEKTFVKEATAAGLDGLKGHRVGRRHARVDLQRVSRRRRRRARASSCGSSSGRTGSGLNSRLPAGSGRRPEAGLRRRRFRPAGGAGAAAVAGAAARRRGRPRPRTCRPPR